MAINMISMMVSGPPTLDLGIAPLSSTSNKAATESSAIVFTACDLPMSD
jgi:hypothetical protein